MAWTLGHGGIQSHPQQQLASAAAAAATMMLKSSDAAARCVVARIAAPDSRCSSRPIVLAAAASVAASPVDNVCSRGASCSGSGLSLQTIPLASSHRFREKSYSRHYPHFVRCTIEPRESLGGIRKIAPLLESASTPGAFNGVHARSTEWRAVPDIWKTAAEKYGHQIALMDPHRSPPVEMTYNEKWDWAIELTNKQAKARAPMIVNDCQLEQSILDFAEGLRVYGIRPNETVALIADNSHRWLISDQGIMAAGAANAVRGSRSSTDELLHIILHSDSVALVVDSPEIYNRLSPRLLPNSKLKFVVVLWGDKSSLNEGVVADPAQEPPLPMYSYEELLKSGQVSRQALAAANNSGDLQCEVILPEDVATLVYTSGTSGNPKAVMLTHANLLHQVENLNAIVSPKPSERFLSLLPPWHMYERSCEYFALSRGVVQVYTSVKNFKEDLVRYPPDFFVAVPLVFDILYSGVQKKLAQSSKTRKVIALTLIDMSLKFMDFRRIFQGKEISIARSRKNALVSAGHWFGATILALILLPIHLLAKKLVFSKILQSINIKKAAISGGGSLSPTVDKFFEAIGITVLNGYGLTETSPVIAARSGSNNVLGSVGFPIPKTEIKVVDPDTDETQSAGSKGLIKVRGPQIMKGYYKNPTATKKAIDAEGWFDTGDLGWICPETDSLMSGRNCAGVLVLDGRAKDTIVLRTGENIEPTQVEEVAMQSEFVQQIVVVGQDQRRLGALIVINKEHPPVASMSEARLRSAVRSDLKRLASEMQSPVGPFICVNEPFTVENGLLTPTLKVRRENVMQHYREDIDNLFAKDSA